MFIFQDRKTTMETLWDKGYVLASREPVEAAMALGRKVFPPPMLKALISKNKNNAL